MARTNQRHRTRKDLLLAATRLLKEGRAPNMGEIADEAMVSRASPRNSSESGGMQSGWARTSRSKTWMARPGKSSRR